jgi:VWFA-related protein
MSPHLFRDQSIATQYAQQLLRQHTDQAFVTTFDRAAHQLQPWTDAPVTLTAAIQTNTQRDPLGGTALYDALYAACHYQFGEFDPRTSGNFILLFSDGEDNASFLDLETAVDSCQHTNTAIYAFTSNPHDGSFHAGTATLAQLAAQTGGAVFHDDDPDLFADLRTIESTLRNRYRLVFRPDHLAHDGAFHRLVLATPDRVATLTLRSGYYAPKPKRPNQNPAKPAPPSPDR